MCTHGTLHKKVKNSEQSPPHLTDFFKVQHPRNTDEGLSCCCCLCLHHHHWDLKSFHKLCLWVEQCSSPQDGDRKMDTDMSESWGAGFKQVCVLMFVKASLREAKSNQTYLPVQQVGTDALLVESEEGKAVHFRGKWSGSALAALYTPAMKGLIEAV